MSSPLPTLIVQIETHDLLLPTLIAQTSIVALIILIALITLITIITLVTRITLNNTDNTNNSKILITLTF